MTSTLMIIFIVGYAFDNFRQLTCNCLVYEKSDRERFPSRSQRVFEYRGTWNKMWITSSTKMKTKTDPRGGPWVIPKCPERNRVNILDAHEPNR